MIRLCAEPSCAEPILLSAQGEVACLSPADATVYVFFFFFFFFSRET